MTDTTISVTGGCLCGKVRYTAAQASPQVSECHCGQCRRQSGHRYAAVRAKTSGMVIDGEDNITWFAASTYARRGFCSACGSHLFWEGDDRDYIALLAASVDEPNALTMARHIFVEGRGAYYHMDDGLPRFEGYDRPVDV